MYNCIVWLHCMILGSENQEHLQCHCNAHIRLNYCVSANYSIQSSLHAGVELLHCHSNAHIKPNYFHVE